jgi:tryptophanyl-tRNA synthetase
MKRRVLSGIQPSGDIHLGNYLGAMKRWAVEQEEHENIYFLANLESLTTKSNIPDLRTNTLKTLAWLLAAGLDPNKSIIFASSQIPAHSELNWILNNFVTMGELSRMTQYKDKLKRLGTEGQIVGLFDYPVLMAADILLYDPDEVPVGEDQKQHVELTRDIANRFNNTYGNVFKIPVATTQEFGARIMNLQDPSRKMSKSDLDQSGVLSLEENISAMTDKIKKAVTDSGKEIKVAENKPAISNLLQVYSLLSGESVKHTESKYEGKGYAEFKSDLADLVIEKIIPLQKTYKDLIGNEGKLLEILEQGRIKANEIAEQKLSYVKNKLGLL